MFKFIFGFTWGITTASIGKYLYNKGRKDAINDINKKDIEEFKRYKKESKS